MLHSKGKRKRKQLNTGYGNEFIYVLIGNCIITAGIYGLFELIIRRKERLTIIEKIGTNWIRPC